MPHPESDSGKLTGSMRVLPGRLADKPQYVFHPGRALRRLMHGFTNTEGRTEVADLPWGLPLEVRVSDSIGFSIFAGRVFDPCVTETLHRLIDPGNRVADVGANVGYLTSLAAVRAGRDGQVLAFEPHPHVFELLERNAARWRDRGIDNVELHRAALSNRQGEGTLVAGPSFDANMGLAALASDEPATAGSDSIGVTLERLDEAVGDRRPDLLKIDVEGHEPDVLRGAERLLASGALRDIVFEDHGEYPSAATSIVESAGYELISLDNDLRGLRLVAPDARGEVREWPGPSYLATLDPARAERRLRPRGWQVSGIGPSLWPWRQARGARQPA
jgi:FkbM family methyltransferase